MTKVSVAINGRTWFTYVPRRAALDLSTVVGEGDAECRGPCVVIEEAAGTKTMCRISRSTPVDLIFVLGWVTHIERMWDQSRIERFLRRLSSFARVLTPWISGSGICSRSRPASRHVARHDTVPGDVGARFGLNPSARPPQMIRDPEAGRSAAPLTPGRPAGGRTIGPGAARGRPYRGIEAFWAARERR